jgi:hypothetical protein
MKFVKLCYLCVDKKIRVYNIHTYTYNITMPAHCVIIINPFGGCFISPPFRLLFSPFKEADN